LKESEERYALAALGSNDGLWDWNLLSNVVHFSPRWKAMLGYQEDEVGDTPEQWFDRIHDADRERVNEASILWQHPVLTLECGVSPFDDAAISSLTRSRFRVMNSVEPLLRCVADSSS